MGLRLGHGDGIARWPHGLRVLSRVGDHPAGVPFVGTGDPLAAPQGRNLRALDLARPPRGFETPRTLADDDAEEHSRPGRLLDDIVSKWNVMSIKQLEPRSRRDWRSCRVVRSTAPGMTRRDDRIIDET